MARYLIRLIGCLEIFGGAAGLNYLKSDIWRVFAGSGSGIQRTVTIVLFSLFVALNSLAIVAGIELIKGSALGRRLSLLVQAVQLPKLLVPLVAFTISFGPEFYFLFHIDPDGNLLFRVTVQPVGQQTILFNISTENVAFGVSVLACVWLVVLKLYDASAYEPAPPISNPMLTRFERVLAWAVTIGGLLILVGAVTGDYSSPIATIEHHFGNPSEATKAFFLHDTLAWLAAPRVMHLAFGTAMTVIGYLCLRAVAWGYWGLFIFFLPQCAQYLSNTFSFSLIGPVSMKFGFNWGSPPAEFNINFLAIAICVIAARTALSLQTRRARAEHVPVVGPSLDAAGSA